MFPQKPALETPAVGRLQNLPKEFAKCSCNSLYGFIVWVVQNRVIEVTDQVEDALLLRARNRVVGRVEIRHQNAGESLESALHQAPFAGLGIEVNHFTPCRKNPHVRCLVVQFDSCFIGMNQVSMYHFVENVLSGFLVVFSSARLEPADDDFVQSEPEQPIQRLSNRTLRNAELNYFKDCKRSKVATICAPIPEFRRPRGKFLASRATENFERSRGSGVHLGAPSNVCAKAAVTGSSPVPSCRL